MVLEVSCKVSNRLNPRWRMVRDWKDRTVVVGVVVIVDVLDVGLLTLLSLG